MLYKIIFLLVILADKADNNDNNNNANNSKSEYSETLLQLKLVEESPAGTQIALIPPPPSGYLPWRLTAANALLTFNSSTGQLLTAAPIDREQLAVNDPETSNKSMLQGYLLAQGANGSRLIRLVVEVLDLNDNAPRVANSGQSLTFSLMESAQMGSRFRLTSVRDGDAAENGTIAGAMLNCFDGAEAAKHFVLAKEGGQGGSNNQNTNVVELSMEILEPVDREQKANYACDIRLWDAGNPPQESRIPFSIHVQDVNDNAPEFEKSQYIVEMPMKTSIRIHAFDRDEGANAAIRYKIVGEKAATQGWQIDAISGELSCQQNQQRECSKETLFAVEAQDRGYPPLSATVSVNVTTSAAATDMQNIGKENSRKINGSSEKIIMKFDIRNLPSGQSFSVFERTAPNGTLLAVLSIVVEGGGKRTFENEGDFELINNYGHKFRIDKIGPQLALLRLNTTANDLMESMGQNGITTTNFNLFWTLEFLASVGQTEVRRRLKIFPRLLNDTAPLALHLQQTVQIAENAPVGTFLARIEHKIQEQTMVDLPIAYKLAAEQENAAIADFVEIHPIAGILRLRQSLSKLKPVQEEMLIKVELGHEAPSLAKSEAKVRIKILDDIDKVSTFSDCPNNHQPWCIFTIKLPENHLVELPILRPQLRPMKKFEEKNSDGDENMRKLKFSLQKFGGDGTVVEQNFRVNPTDGQIFLRQPLNFEQHREHRFWLHMEEEDHQLLRRKISKALVEIFVQDVNDEAPRFPWSPAQDFLAVRLSQPLHQPLYRARAEDSDLEDQRLGLRYVLLDTTFVGLFHLDHGSGWLTLAKPLEDFELGVGREFSLQIEAIDQANRKSPHPPLQLNIRIVADSARVAPPAIEEDGEEIFRTIKFPRNDDCLEDDQILEQLGLVDGQVLANISPLLLSTTTSTTNLSSVRFDQPPPPIIWSNGSAICLGLSGNAASFPVRLDLGPDGWLMAMVDKEEKKLKQNESADSNFQNGKEIMEMEKARAWKMMMEEEEEEAAVDVPISLPPTMSFYVSSENNALRPGDLLVNLLANATTTYDKFSSSSVQFTLVHPKQRSQNWSEASENGNEFVDLFPDGQIRFLGNLPPGNRFKWKAQVQAQQKHLLSLSNEEIVLRQLVDISLHIQTTQPSIPLKCPEVAQKKFLWNISFVPGTVLGKLPTIGCGDGRNLCRTKMVGPSNGLLLEPGNGKLIIGQSNVPDALSNNNEFTVHYETVALATGQEIGCTASVQIVHDSGEEKSEENSRESAEFTDDNGRRRTALFNQWKKKTIAAAASATTFAIHQKQSPTANEQFRNTSGRKTFIRQLQNDTEVNAASNNGDKDKLLLLQFWVPENVADFHVAELRETLFYGNNQSATSNKLKFELLDMDADEKDMKLKYHRGGNNAHLLPSLPFSIDTVNGTLKMTTPLDAEKCTFYTFQVRVLHKTLIGWTELQRANVQIYVLDENEHAPSMANKSKGPLFVREDTEVGARLFKLDWTDQDISGYLWAEVDAERTDSNTAELFCIDADGWLCLAARLDREKQVEHRVHIRLWDNYRQENDSMNAALSSTIELLIVVQDVNDNAPMFLPSMTQRPLEFFVEENAPLGAVFGNLRAWDPDAGENGTVHFRVVPSSLPSAEVLVDPVFGYLMTNSHLDREEQVQLHFHVQSYDQGSPPLVTEAEVRVRIVDQDDNPFELLDGLEEQISVPEDVAEGELLKRFECRDRDEGINAICLYKITAGNMDGFFALGLASGRLTLVRSFLELSREALNKKKKQEFRLNISVSAFSGKWPAKQIHLKITVLPVNRPPHFPIDQQFPIFFETDEERTAFPLLLRQIVAVDLDEGENGSLTYTLLNANEDLSLFKLNSETGELSILRPPLNDNRLSEHRLQILASDNARHPLSANLDILIRIRTTKTETTKMARSNVKRRQLSSSSSSALVITPPVHSVHLSVGSNGVVVNSSLTNAIREILRYKVDLANKEGKKYETIIRFRILEEMCQYEKRKMKKASGNHHFSIDPIEGRLMLMGQLDAEDCQLWKVRIGAFPLELEWKEQNLEEEAEAELLVWVDKDEADFNNKNKIAEAMKIRVGGPDVFFPSSAKPGDTVLAVDIFLPEGIVGAPAPSIWLAGEDAPKFTIDQRGLLKLAKDLPGGKEKQHEFSVLIGIGKGNETATDVAGMEQANALMLRLYTADQEHFPRFNNSPHHIHLPPLEEQSLQKRILRPLAKFSAYLPGAKMSSSNNIIGPRKVERNSDYNSNNPDRQTIFYSIAAGDPLDAFFRLDPFTGQLFWKNPTTTIADRKLLLSEQLQIAATSTLGPYSTFWSVRLVDNNNNTEDEEASAVENLPNLLPLDCYFVQTTTDEEEKMESGEMVQQSNVAGGVVLNSPFLSVEWPENELLPLSKQGLARIAVRNSAGPFNYGFVDANPLIAKNSFRIDQQTGTVHLDKELDRETVDRIRLTIAVSTKEEEQRWQRQIGKCILEIIVLDRNDNPPRFDHILSLELDEAMEPGSIVYRINVSDSDSAAENTQNVLSLMMDVDDAVGSEKFQLKPSGELILMENLKAEKKSDYRLTVLAQDGEWQVQSVMHIHVGNQSKIGEEEASVFKMKYSQLQDGFEFWHFIATIKSVRNRTKTTTMLGQIALMDSVECWPSTTTNWLWMEPNKSSNGTTVWADFGLAEMLGAIDDSVDQLRIPLWCFSIEAGMQLPSQIRIHFNRTEKKKFRSPTQKMSRSKCPTIVPMVQAIELPEFAHQIWDFQLARDSPPGTIVGQIQMLRHNDEATKSTSSNNNKSWLLLLDQHGETLCSLNQQKGELILKRHSFVEENSSNRFGGVGNSSSSSSFSSSTMKQFWVAVVPKMQRWVDNGEAKSALIRLHFLDHLPAMPTFSRPSYSVQLPLTSLQRMLGENNQTKMTPTTLELLHFDFHLPNGSQIVVEQSQADSDATTTVEGRRRSWLEFLSKQICFPETSSSITPTMLNFCQTNGTACWLQKLAKNSAQNFPLQMELSLRDQMGQIRSRTVVSIEIIVQDSQLDNNNNVTYQLKESSLKSPFRLGFLRQRSPAGMHVLRLPPEPGPWKLVDAANMEKIFRLNSSTGILSTVHPTVPTIGSSSQHFYTVYVQSATMMAPHINGEEMPESLLLLISVDPTTTKIPSGRQNSQQNSNNELPTTNTFGMEIFNSKKREFSHQHIFVPIFTDLPNKIKKKGIEETTRRTINILMNEREDWEEEAACEAKEWKIEMEMAEQSTDGDAKLYPNCTLSISFSISSDEQQFDNLKRKHFQLGSMFSVELQSVELLNFAHFYVQISAFCLRSAVSAMLKILANSVPDLSLLVPISLTDDDGLFSVDAAISTNFPRFHRLLLTFRDPNGLLLPADETMAILEHFAHKNPPEQLLGLWEFRITKLRTFKEENCDAEDLTNQPSADGETVHRWRWFGEESLKRCLLRAESEQKPMLATLNALDTMWTHLSLPSSCLDPILDQEEDEELAATDEMEEQPEVRRKQNEELDEDRPVEEEEGEDENEQEKKHSKPCIPSTGKKCSFSRHDNTTNNNNSWAIHHPLLAALPIFPFLLLFILLLLVICCFAILWIRRKWKENTNNSLDSDEQQQMKQSKQAKHANASSSLLAVNTKRKVRQIAVVAPTNSTTNGNGGTPTNASSSASLSIRSGTRPNSEVTTDDDDCNRVEPPLASLCAKKNSKTTTRNSTPMHSSSISTGGFSADSTDFSQQQDLPAEAAQQQGNDQHQLMQQLMAENNSNFYQEVLLDWSNGKDYVNWPPPVFSRTSEGRSCSEIDVILEEEEI